MKFAVCVLILLSFYKSIFYAMYEYKEKQNKLAGIGLYFLSIASLFFPIWVLLTWY